jgi:hypothetical protein
MPRPQPQAAAEARSLFKQVQRGELRIPEARRLIHSGKIGGPQSQNFRRLTLAYFDHLCGRTVKIVPEESVLSEMEAAALQYLLTCSD